MTIGELSQKSGVPASTIRYCDRIGVLPRPGRVSGQRRYAADAIDRFAVLRRAQASGCRLVEVGELSFLLVEVLLVLWVLWVLLVLFLLYKIFHHKLDQTGSNRRYKVEHLECSECCICCQLYTLSL